MSLSKSLTSSANTIDKNVDSFVKNETYVNLFRVALIGYAVFVHNVPDNVINLFDKFVFRLVITLLVAYLLFKDVITALLLALCFILSVQELKKRGNLAKPMYNTFDNYGALLNNTADSDKQLNTPSNTSSENNIKDPINSLLSATIMPEDVPDPAFKTMTQNIVEGSFTSDAQFLDAQSNGVQGADPDTGVKTFVNQHGAQGLDVPLGQDPLASMQSAF